MSEQWEVLLSISEITNFTRLARKKTLIETHTGTFPG